MGQPLPLPERIPRPNETQLRSLELMGITVIEDEMKEDLDKHDKIIKSSYLRYTLPQGWKMVDASWRQEFPDYYIIDGNGMKRVSVGGSWKGIYDNSLSLCVFEDDSIKFEDDSIKSYTPPQNNTMDASENIWS